jgi:divalent metal cation (Fe/Co/Zn/Cd) transporter
VKIRHRHDHLATSCLLLGAATGILTGLAHLDFLPSMGVCAIVFAAYMVGRHDADHAPLTEDVARIEAEGFTDAEVARLAAEALDILDRKERGR